MGGRTRYQEVFTIKLQTNVLLIPFAQCIRTNYLKVNVASKYMPNNLKYTRNRKSFNLS